MPASNTGNFVNPHGPIADEIAHALLRHRKAANGLILGLEKYRQLRARTPNLGQGYQGMSLLIDASQPQRVSVF